jgi:hypothetical protein
MKYFGLFISYLLPFLIHLISSIVDNDQDITDKFNLSKYSMSYVSLNKCLNLKGDNEKPRHRKLWNAY